jgi:hypothetical protein
MPHGAFKHLKKAPDAFFMPQKEASCLKYPVMLFGGIHFKALGVFTDRGIMPLKALRDFYVHCNSFIQKFRTGVMFESFCSPGSIHREAPSKPTRGSSRASYAPQYMIRGTANAFEAFYTQICTLDDAKFIILKIICLMSKKCEQK